MDGQNKFRSISVSKIFTVVLPFLLLIVMAPQWAFSQVSCESNLTKSPHPNIVAGARFLHSKDQRLHTTPLIQRVVQRTRRKTGLALQKPVEKIQAWIQSLDAIQLKANGSNFVRNQIKDIFRSHYVIRPDEIPEAYYALQIKIARERGHGEIDLTDVLRNKFASVLIADQTASLNTWVDYLLSPDFSFYPLWVKIWVFNGMTKLSKFDAATATFSKRGKSTVGPFPELNREVLAYVIDRVAGQSNGKTLEGLSDSELRKIAEKANFGKLYAQELHKITVNQTSQSSTTTGEWIHYPRGSDFLPLVKSLEGRNTGWCTAGRETAKRQLEVGDFYVYYSNDESSQPTLPRIAIRMEGDDIAEVRGISKDQNLDSQIAGSDILSKKMNEFGERADEFNKKVQDMKRLTEIDQRAQTGNPLSRDDLRFLYEIDAPIKGFGYSKDPRVSVIIQNRNPKNDLAYAMDVDSAKISVDSKEALKEGVVLHFGNLVVFGQGYNQKLPQTVIGDVSILDGYLPYITLPIRVAGSFSLGSKIKEINGVILPESIDGDLEIGHLDSISGLTWPKRLGGKLTLSSSLAATYRDDVPAEIVKIKWAGDIWRIRHR